LIPQPIRRIIGQTPNNVLRLMFAKASNPIMTEPETVQAIVLPDGRSLAFAEYGDPTGCAVFHFH